MSKKIAYEDLSMFYRTYSDSLIPGFEASLPSEKEFGFQGCAEEEWCYQLEEIYDKDMSIKCDSCLIHLASNPYSMNSYRYSSNSDVIKLEFVFNVNGRLQSVYVYVNGSYLAEKAFILNW